MTVTELIARRRERLIEALTALDVIEANWVVAFGPQKLAERGQEAAEPPVAGNGSSPASEAPASAERPCSQCGSLFTPPSRPEGQGGRQRSRCDRCRRHGAEPPAELVSTDDLPPDPLADQECEHSLYMTGRGDRSWVAELLRPPAAVAGIA